MIVLQIYAPIKKNLFKRNRDNNKTPSNEEFTDSWFTLFDAVINGQSPHKSRL